MSPSPKSVSLSSRGGGYLTAIRRPQGIIVYFWSSLQIDSLAEIPDNCKSTAGTKPKQAIKPWKCPPNSKLSLSETGVKPNWSVGEESLGYLSFLPWRHSSSLCRPFIATGNTRFWWLCNLSFFTPYTTDLAVINSVTTEPWLILEALNRIVFSFSVMFSKYKRFKIRPLTTTRECSWNTKLETIAFYLSIARLLPFCQDRHASTIALPISLQLWILNPQREKSGKNPRLPNMKGA